MALLRLDNVQDFGWWFRPGWVGALDGEGGRKENKKNDALMLISNESNQH